MSKYLLAVDESEQARSAYNLAISMINKQTDQLFLLNVREPAPLPVWMSLEGLDVVPQATESEKVADERLAARSTAILHHFSRKAKEDGVLHYKLINVISSEFGEAICDVVDEKGIDFLIMGRRGMGAFKRMLLGSVSDYCVKNAHCNVVIAKEDFGPAQIHVPKRFVVGLEEEERERRLKDEAFAKDEKRRLSHLNHEITVLQEVRFSIIVSQEEERRRLLREKAYGEALRQNAAKTAALIANADAPDVARANAHAIEMLHHHTAF